MAKKALLRGWYGYHNIGDEAMLRVLIDQLHQAGCQTMVASADPAYTQRIHQTRAIPAGMNWNFLRALVGADILIEGPGNKHGFFSIIGQGVPFVAKLLGKEVRYIATGISPHVWQYAPLHKRPQVMRFKNPLQRWLVRLLFDCSVDYVSLRSAGSIQVLRANGVRTDLHLVRDLAYDLPCPSKAEIRPALFQLCGIDVLACPTVGVTLRRFVNEAHNVTFAERIAEVINRVLAAQPIQFVFIGFAKYKDDDDAVFSRRIVELVAAEYRERVYILDDERPEIVKGAIGACDLVIAVRYHAQVFAAACQVPFVAIVYDPKSEEVAQHGVLRFDIDDIEVDKLTEQIACLANKR